MKESSVELLADFQKKYPKAGKDPLLKKIFKQYKYEITRCSICGHRERDRACVFCREWGRQ